jgi:hypothetical protein
MLLVFDDKHKEDLEFLKTTNVSIITEFCKIAVNFIKSGANKKLFAGAARAASLSIFLVCCVARVRTFVPVYVLTPRTRRGARRGR